MCLESHRRRHSLSRGLAPRRSPLRLPLGCAAQERAARTRGGGGMNRTVTATKVSATGIVSRVESLDWAQIVNDLDAYGCAAATGVLLPEQCRALAALYDQDGLFRRRIVMSRHGFGRGEYKYWAHPLPEAGATLRCALYPPLAQAPNPPHPTMPIHLPHPAD